MQPLTFRNCSVKKIFPRAFKIIAEAISHLILTIRSCGAGQVRDLPRIDQGRFRSLAGRCLGHQEHLHNIFGIPVQRRPRGKGVAVGGLSGCGDLLDLGWLSSVCNSAIVPSDRFPTVAAAGPIRSEAEPVVVAISSQRPRLERGAVIHVSVHQGASVCVLGIGGVWPGVVDAVVLPVDTVGQLMVVPVLVPSQVAAVGRVGRLALGAA